MPPKAPKPPPPKAPEEALRWLKDKVPFTREEYEKLRLEARKRAFFVSNVAQLRLVSQVHKAITKAVAKGTTLDDFKKAVGAKLADEWGGPKPALLETIFRTNVQSAYNAGRLEQFEEPVIKRLRPYRAWSVIVDTRTTEFICLPLRNLVVNADSAFAKSHIPPLHFRCRTGIMALGEDAAESVRLPQHIPELPPQEGFGGDPRTSVRGQADLSGEPPELLRILSHKAGPRGSEEGPNEN